MPTLDSDAGRILDYLVYSVSSRDGSATSEEIIAALGFGGDRYLAACRHLHSLGFIRETIRIDQKSFWEISATSRGCQEIYRNSAAQARVGNEQNLDTEAIRNLLIDAFDDTELEAFCFDHFYPVYNEKFSRGMGKDEKAQCLMDHCVRHGKLETLVELVKERNQEID